MKVSRGGIVLIKVIGLLTVTALLVFFNNCGSKFDPASEANSSSESSSAASSIDHELIPVDSSLLAFQNANQVADNLPLAVNVPYQFQIVGDGPKPITANWSSSCAMTGSDLMTRTITCSSVGTMQVQVAMTFTDSAPTTKSFSRAVSASQVTTPPSNLVAFDIQNGTAKGKWNQPTAPATAFIGQTLRITNLDSTVHRLHTGGNPCPHEATNLAQGQFYDCVVTKAHVATATDTYDHNIGTSANFYVQVIDGAAVYAQKFNIAGVMKSCADCHGALATSAKKNASFAQIKAAIAANKGGMGAITLTDDQLHALEYQLSR